MKQRNRLALLLASALLGTAVCGCSGGTTAFDKQQNSANSGSDTSGLKIAYSAIANGDNAPWAGALWDEMENVCSEHSWTLSALSAGGVPATQTQQIKQLLAENPDYFVIFAGDATLCDEWVREIHNSGIPVILAGIDATGSAQEYVSAYVGPDQEALSSQLAADMIWANGNDAGLGVISISGFQFQQDYILRRQGFEKTLSYFSNYDLLANGYAGADRDAARQLVEDYYADYGDRIDIIMCYDDEFAMGALDAVDALGMQDVQIYSITGSSEALQQVQDGRITEIAMVSAEQIADGCGDVIDGLENGTIPNHYNYTDRTYATGENIKTLLDQGEY